MGYPATNADRTFAPKSRCQRFPKRYTEGKSTVDAVMWQLRINCLWWPLWNHHFLCRWCTPQASKDCVGLHATNSITTHSPIVFCIEPKWSEYLWIHLMFQVNFSGSKPNLTKTPTLCEVFWWSALPRPCPCPYLAPGIRESWSCFIASKDIPKHQNLY